jgi:hypothetical protein
MGHRRVSHTLYWILFAFYPEFSTPMNAYVTGALASRASVLLTRGYSSTAAAGFCPEWLAVCGCFQGDVGECRRVNALGLRLQRENEKDALTRVAACEAAAGYEPAPLEGRGITAKLVRYA